MDYYHLNAEKVEKQAKKYLYWRSIPLMTIAMASGIIIVGQNQSDAGVLYFIGGLTVSIFLFFGIRGAKKRIPQIINSFCLEIDVDQLVIAQFNLPKISISKNEISKLIENRRGVIIKGKGIKPLALIPNTLQDYSLLKEQLQEWRRIETITKTEQIKQYFWSSLPFVMITGFLAFFFAENALIVILLGLILTIAIIAILVQIQTSKHIETTMKRKMWLILLILIPITLRILSFL